jgi:hypothetical protein
MSLDEARQLAAELKARDANVEYAEPDRIMVPLAIPTDPMYTQQWDYYEATGGLNAARRLGQVDRRRHQRGRDRHRLPSARRPVRPDPAGL